MSWMRCDSCDMGIDTDVYPSAFVAEGEAVLCISCMEDPDVALAALKSVLKALEAQHIRSQRTDAAYANSGRWATHERRMADVRSEIELIRKDHDRWLEIV